jgi:hypothetical protein
MAENRVYRSLPTYLQTKTNRRWMAATEDVLYEREAFEQVEGQIGDVSGVPEDQLARSPQIRELDAERQKYQLSVSAVSRDDAGNITGGAFYTDLIGQLAGNGAIIDDHARLFATGWYAWSPPIDLDKWTNFQKYFWTGPGIADVQGEFITKEPAGTQIRLHRWTGSAWVADPVTPSVLPVGSFPAGAAVGELREDSTTPERIIYRWSGTGWSIADWTPVADVPADGTGFSVGGYAYVARAGHEFQRPIIHEYSSAAGRWIARLIVISVSQPEGAVEGMFWEDARTSGIRAIYRYNGTAWVIVGHQAVSSVIGLGTAADGSCRYDARSLASLDDGWQANNWWRHFSDLSPTDRSAYASQQATRPILEHWGGIDPYPGDARSARHDMPRYRLFAYKDTGSSATSGIVEINVTNFGPTNTVVSSAGSTLVQYRVGTGSDDGVLGFPVAFNDTGEFTFDLTLESQQITYGSPATELEGYRFFRDRMTGLVHGAWARSSSELEQDRDADGVWELPLGLTNNPDHGIPERFSRSEILSHVRSVIAANASGSGLGTNSYRWSRKDPIAGATIIDTDAPLLKSMALLQSADLDYPDAIRTMAHEYSRTMAKFISRMNQLWLAGELAGPDDVLTVSATTAVDRILTEMFAGRTEDFPFHGSGMGTFVDADTSEVRPIYFPASPARAGCAPPYQPARLLDSDGGWVIQGHDGSRRDSFGDDRDLLLLNLENRFYSAVPASYKSEDHPSGQHLNITAFELGHYVGNWTVRTNERDVDEIVADYNMVVSPAAGHRVFSASHVSFADWTGTQWRTEVASVGDKFFDISSGDYYIYNGHALARIDRHVRPGSYDYTINEFQAVVRREYERWVITAGLNPYVNADFDGSDPFTWNYSSAGVEGHWRGIYRRIYGTDRPHSHPWEVWGYSIEPSWWRTVYVPTSTAADGTPRYTSGHAMWGELKVPISPPVTVSNHHRLSPTAPVPVGPTGELLDPIASGVITLDSLDAGRIGERWAYGDGSPVEEAFRRSHLYSFSLALAGYLMKPARFVEYTWADQLINIGGVGTFGEDIWRGPHVVGREYLTRPGVADVPIHGELVNGSRVSVPGTCSWLAEKLTILGIDADENLARVIRRSSVALGWRMAGFANKNRTSVRTPAGIEIPFEDIFLLVHQSAPTDTKFHSGVNIVRSGTGYRVYGYDGFDPYFRTEPGLRPSIGGQVVRSQTFVAQQGQIRFVVTSFEIPGESDTAAFGVVVDGARVPPENVSRLSSGTFELINLPPLDAGAQVTASVTTVQGTLSTRVRQFSIDDRTFYYYPAGSGRTEEYAYGHLFADPQEVVEFLVDHGRYQSARGWVYDEKDSEFSHEGDWLLTAKKFAAWAMTRRQEGEVFSDVPGGALIKHRAEFGNLMSVERVYSGGYSVIDIAGMPIRPEDTFATRIGSDMEVGSRSNNKIYGLRIGLNEIQHALFVSNRTKFNDLIYDPVIGLRQKRLTIKTYRSKSWNGRLEAPGYVVNGGEVLPNFDKQARDFTRYYDRLDFVDDPVKRDQALNLYNFHEKQYTRDLEVSPALAFEFHRGMMAHKGTRKATLAFSRATRAGTAGLELTEVWAWKLADFGDSTYTRVQFSLDERDMLRQVAVIRFGPDDGSDTVIPVPAIDRSVQPPIANRWIRPPTGPNLTFPLSDGLPEIGDTTYRLTMLETSSNESVAHPFNWDPARGLHEPSAYAEIWYESPYDPARYTAGPMGDRGRDIRWGKDQVGRLWWDTTEREYKDYRSGTDPLSKADRWGKLSDHQVTSLTRTSIEVTVATATAHGYQVGDMVRVFGSEQPEYNGTWEVDSVPGATSFTFQYLGGGEPVSPATGDIRTTKREVAVYEWVESTVPPDKWAELVEQSADMPDEAFGYKPSGEAKDADDPSWVEVFDGQETLYYFWVRHSTTIRPGSSMSARQVEELLLNPTSSQRAWFSPIDADSMIFFPGGTEVSDLHSLELVIDRRQQQDQHAEWLLVSEGSSNEAVPEAIVSSVLDSLAGTDSLGNPIPSPLFVDVEKYGNTRPGQTLFADLASARTVFLEAINRILRSRNLADEMVQFSEIFNGSGLFPVVANGYWSQADYVGAALDGVLVTQVVANRTERDALTQMAMGDMVRVKSDGIDPLQPSIPTHATYRWSGTAWEIVGAQKASAALNSNVFSGPFKDRMRELFAAMPMEDVNEVIFSVLYEMLAQHQHCDWFFKTSLVDMVYESRIGQPEVNPIDELPVLSAQFNDLKPFRTKLRNSIAKVSLDQPDQADTEAGEIVDHVTGLVYDRLSCNTYDDFGWDVKPHDVDPWDVAPWDMDDLGRAYWLSMGSFTTVALVREYRVPNVSPVYQVRLRAFDGGGNELGVSSHSIVLDGDEAVVTFTANPIPGVLHRLEMTQGIVNGPDPVLPENMTSYYAPIEPFEGSYKHAFARLWPLRNSDGSYQYPDVCSLMDGCFIDISQDGGSFTTQFEDIISGGAFEQPGTTDSGPNVSSQLILPASSSDTVLTVSSAAGFTADPIQLATITTNATSAITLAAVGPGPNFVLSYPDVRVLLVQINGTTLIESDSANPTKTFTVAYGSSVSTVTINYTGLSASDSVSIHFEHRMAERVRIINIIGNTLQVTRGMGTVALNFASGAQIVQSAQPPISGDQGQNVYDGGYINSTTDRADRFDPPGGEPEERVATEPSDIGSITVITDWTPAYAGWDATPWDSVGFDQAPPNVGKFTWTHNFGPTEPDILGSTEILPLSEDIVSDGSQIIRAGNLRMGIAQVHVDNGFGFQQLVEGTNYTVFSQGIVTLLPIPDQTFVSDGSTLVFPITGPRDPVRVFVGNEEISSWTFSSGDLTLFSAPPTGDTIRVVIRPAAVAGDTVRLVFDSVILRSADAEITAWPTGSVVSQAGLRVSIAPVPVPGDQLSIRYKTAVMGIRQPSANYAIHGVDVDDMLPTFDVLDQPGAIDTGREFGERVVDMSDRRIMVWDGTTWIHVDSVYQDCPVWIASRQELWKWNGADWQLLYGLRTDHQNRPIVPYPRHGAGLTSGGYALGIYDRSATLFPAAFDTVHAPVPEPYQDVAFWVANHSAWSAGSSGVSGWSDLSLQPVHPSQTVAAQQPLFQSDDTNTLSGIRFDGVDDSLEAAPSAPNIWSANGGGYALAVVRSSASGSGTGGIIGKSGFWSISIVNSGGRKVRFTCRFSGSTGTWTSVTPLPAAGNLHILEVQYSASSVLNNPIIWVNGVQQSIVRDVAPSGSVSSDSATGIVLGRNGASFFGGWIYEAFAMNRTPPVLNRIANSCAMLHKWVEAQYLFNIVTEDGALLQSDGVATPDNLIGRGLFD